MLEVTVKTLDGRNRTFNVADDITVKKFKEEIASSIEIEADVQRLIYRGRVLVDEKKINDYDVNGKTLHVVQRPPPQVGQMGQGSNMGPQSSSRPRMRPSNQGTFEFRPFNLPNHGNENSNQSESRNRIKQATKMLNLAKEALNKLESIGEASNSASAQVENSVEDEEMDTSEQPESRSENETPQQSQEPVPPQSQQQTEDSTDPPTSALAVLLDDVLHVNERMESHIRRYRDLMNSPEEAETRSSIETVCRVTSQAMHLMSHVYHNISDLFCDFNTTASNSPRLLQAFPPPPRHATAIIQQTIPVQVSAQFNVSPVLRENNPSPPSCTATTTATETTTASSGRSAGATTQSTTASGATNFSTAFSDQVHRVFGGELPPFNFMGAGRMGGGGLMGPPPPGAEGGFRMFMEMNPDGTLSMRPESSSTSTTSTTTTASSQAASNATTAPNMNSTTTSGSASSETTTSSSTRPANVTVTGTGSTPNFLNGDFFQNIIQMATGAAFQNESAQRPQVWMMNPHMTFMGPGQGPQMQRRVRRTGVNQHQHQQQTTSSTATTSAAGTTASTTQAATSNGGSNRSDGTRGQRENVITDPYLPCHSYHFGSRMGRQNDATNDQTLAGLVSNIVSSLTSASADDNMDESSSVATDLSVNSGTQTSTTSSTNQQPNNLNPFAALFSSFSGFGTAQQQQQQQQRNESATGAPANRNMPSTLDPLVTQLLQSFISRQEDTLASFLSTLGTDYNPAPGEGLLSDLFLCLTPHLTFSDFFELFLGQHRPLQKLRQPLQAFVNDHILAGSQPTEENVRFAVDRIISVIQPDIQEAADSAQANEDIDFAASATSFLRFHLMHIINLIVNATDDVAFAEELFRSLKTCLHGLVNLCRFCLKDEDRAIEVIVQNRMQSLLIDVNPTLLPWMNQVLLQNLNSHLPTIPRSNESIKLHIIRHSAGDQSATAAFLVTGVTRDTDVESTTESFESASGNNTEERMEDDQASHRLLNDQLSRELPLDGHYPRISDEVLARLPPPPRDDEEIGQDDVKVESGTRGWENIVPNEWVPVISRDGVRQRRQASSEIHKQPLSDAYLSGIPPKRRKLMKERCATTQTPTDSQLNMDLAESLRMAANQVNVQPITSFQAVDADLEANTALCSAYREEINSAIRNKLSEDPEFSPSKYPHSKDFYKPK